MKFSLVEDQHPDASDLPSAEDDFFILEAEAIDDGQDMPFSESFGEETPPEHAESTSPPLLLPVPLETVPDDSMTVAPYEDQNELTNIEADSANQKLDESDSSTPCGKRSNLFKVMSIVSDKQDYSFVEKVQLPEDEILLLCNELVPNSAVAVGEPPQIRINFNALNERCLPVVGFYGDKQMMTEVFRNELFGLEIDNAVGLAQLEPGLYAGVVREEAILIFYWHQGEHFKDASRKDVSCNFIRYLVELCDYVHVCVEGNYPFDALIASAKSACSKQKRTQRLQISHVKNSENDVKISPGFNVRIDRQLDITSTDVIPTLHNTFFCEGYYRCSFLTAEYKAPRIHRTTEMLKAVKASDLRNLIDKWALEYDIDFCRLSNDHFISLLKYCKLPEYYKYRNMKEHFETTVRSTPESAFKSGVENIKRCFLKILPEYCKQVLSLWDLCSGNESNNSGISKDKLNSELNSECGQQDVHCSVVRFDQLHRELSMILSGKDGDRRLLLLVGSEVKFTCDNATQIFTIGTSQKQTGPIIYGQEINLICSSQLPGNIDGKATFLQIYNAQKDFVLSGDRLVLKLLSKAGRLQGTIEVVNNSVSALRAWVESMIPEQLLNLERNVGFLPFLLSSGVADQRTTYISSSQIQKLLLTADYKLQERPDEISRLFVQFRSNPTQFTLDQASCHTLASHENSKKIFSQVYKLKEEEFLRNVEAMVKKDLWSMVEKKLIRAERSAKEKQFKEEENMLLSQFKRNMSVKTGKPGVKYIEQVSTAVEQNSFVGKYLNLLNTSTYHSSEKVDLKVSVEQEQKLGIQWKVCELAPMKKDMDELNFNSVHPIIPTCTQSVELVTINPECERLVKVVLLKSGESLIFIHNHRGGCLYVYHCPRIGTKLYNRNPIHTFRRGFDLLCVDEGTRLVALYDAGICKVGIYRFDDSFRHVDWTGVEVELEKYSGSKIITWMHFIPGKRELLLVDDTNRVRTVELHQKPMMKPRHISLPLPLSKACISVDGLFLIVFRKSSETKDDSCTLDERMKSSSMDVDDRKSSNSGVRLEIYVLGDIMTYLKSIDLNVSIENMEELEVKIMSFGPQSHIVFRRAEAPDSICSKMLKTFSAKESAQLQEIVGENKAFAREGKEISASCPALEYIYHIFDKFATSPALFPEFKRTVTFNVLLETRDSSGKKCMEYLRTLLRQLRVEKGKDFSNTKIQLQVQNFNRWLSNGVEDLFTSMSMGMGMGMGEWTRNLVCLVPIQIARAENNGMVALKDGLQIPAHLSYADSISLANLMRFGFYEAVLNNWEGEIKVISSMGKQSSGKSYLLNHLSGSLLDVAGGRCTDGVWMTVRAGDKCIYVLLDFEGLGSFERTEQEDMLLSVLNAAISDLTIFNKKDFHLDKDTEAVFDRFQNGISLVKHDNKLFKGIFYIAIKDVDSSDVEDLKREFHEKIFRICHKSQENFITKMYGGKVEIAAMPPYNRPEYQESLRDITCTVDEIGSCYENGFTFLRDLKLVLSQIAAKDWTPVDSKRVALKVDILRRNLKCAINTGCLSARNEVKMLVNFDTQEEVGDWPIVLGELRFNIGDSGLELAPSDESMAIGDILSHLRVNLDSVLQRKGNNGDLWHSTFERFLCELTDRRRERVQEWLSSNTRDFSGYEEVQKLHLEAAAALAELKQGLSVCGCKCSECFWRCVLEKGHLSSSHSCMGSHRCAEQCSYCAQEGDENSAEECKDLAGHEGRHDCKMRNHTCGETCDLFGKSSNCNRSCSLKLSHLGSHMCNSPQHMCKRKCSLPSCRNPCVVPIEFGDHDRHSCHERYCQSPCIINGCTRTCGHMDHFHALNADAEHLCGNEHACREKCEMPGICEIFTELVRQTRHFQGRRGSFEYEHVSEQNGLRKDCCILVPPFKRSHEGPHVHTKNEEALHYCDARCQSCGYFCHLPMDHPGLHNTVHGNMRNVRFISDTEEIDIHDRKYTWGESGLAEMCNMHCKAQGRGHIHLVPCPDFNDQGNCTSKLYDGSRHETVKYGPDVDVPKDEMTHETFWKYVRFVDPCSEEEQQEFGLCNHHCRSEEHDDPSDNSAKSYCTEKLWHAPIQRSGMSMGSMGYITDDGHHFGCDHSKNVPHHVIFVIDKSGSMGSIDITPTMSKFVALHNCRLGCVYEAILRFITTRLRTVSDDSVSVVLFDCSAVVAVQIQDMTEGVVDQLLQYDADGGTTYSSGLDLAEKMMIKASTDPTTDMKRPFVVFLSDGGNNGGGDPLYYVNRMKQQEPRMILHTIMFGTDPTKNILIEMANIGNGTFQLSLDEVQLARSFENLASSLKPQVAALM